MLVMKSERIYYWLLIPIVLLQIFKLKELNKILYIYFIIYEKSFAYTSTFFNFQKIFDFL